MGPNKTTCFALFVIISLLYVSYKAVEELAIELEWLYEQIKAKISPTPLAVKEHGEIVKSNEVKIQMKVRQWEEIKKVNETEIKKVNETEIKKVNETEINKSKLKVNLKKINVTKFILQWKLSSSIYMGHGQEVFKKCSFTNCYITDDKHHLGNYSKFDVIAFPGFELEMITPEDLPAWRAPHQKYVFTTIEAKHNGPICNTNFNNFFNWTWTYRLDSDLRWDYIVVRDSKGNIVGPKEEMHWMRLEDMDHVSNDLKKSFRTKSKAAAWFVSDCGVSKETEKAARSLQQYLVLYELSIDIYGQCTGMKCGNKDECNKMIERDYYFYLAFEDTYTDDYVTEELLHALQHYAVPIVFGGANYTRFMPEGIYLDAVEMAPAELAEKINELMKNINKYAEYFRWKKHYSYHAKNESVDTDNYCSMCALLNNKEQMENKTIHTDLLRWWNTGFTYLCATGETMSSNQYNDSDKILASAQTRSVD